MDKPIKIINVEDLEDDSVLIQWTLQREGIECNMHRVDTRDGLVHALQELPCDLILSDYTLPGFGGMEALKIAQELRPQIPFIFVSGTLREQAAIDCLRHGAEDYILKDRLWQLIPTIRHVITEMEGRTQIGEMETELRESRKMASIATMSGGLIHDFRNLLQILKLNIALLPPNASAPEEVKRLAEQLDKTTDRGCSLTQDFLIYARKTDLHLSPVDVADHLASTVETIRPTLPPKVKLRTALLRNPPTIKGDPAQLDRIFFNLIRNAVDAMPQGGIINISTDLVRFDAVPPEHDDVPYVRVIVSDTGAGMDAATRARVFEPFFTTKAAGAGTGLGLSVVLSLMEAHRGFVDLQTEPGNGTSFSLFFPTVVEASPAMAPAVASQGGLSSAA